MNKLLVVGGIVVSILSFWLVRNAGKEMDLRTAKIGDDGIELTAYSFKRKMINKIIIDKEELVWVPNGYGWYRSGSVKKLLENEKKTYLLDKMMLFGLGFDVNLWVVDGGVDRAMISKWGWYPWLKFKIEESSWLYKEENLTNLKDKGDLIDRMMQRDMADSDTLESKVRVVVYNSTVENGLASFIGRDIERLGFAVTGTQNAEVEDISCRITSKSKYEIFNKHFSDCEIKLEDNLPENEIEIYFGEKFAQMINYDSYN